MLLRANFRSSTSKEKPISKEERRAVGGKGGFEQRTVIQSVEAAAREGTIVITASLGGVWQ